MKKYIILFATIIAMSEMSFGQNQAKVLWEDIIYSRQLINRSDSWIGNIISPSFSPMGNILVQYNYNIDNIPDDRGIRVYDANGKVILKPKDFNKNPLTRYNTTYNENKNYKVLFSYTKLVSADYATEKDSAFYLNKEYKFLRGFDIHSPNTTVFYVNDGIIYRNSQKTLIKYDINGNEEWRYESLDIISVGNPNPPYYCVQTTPNNQTQILILDAKGKKKGITNPTNNWSYFPTNDKGFWFHEGANELVRYDSTVKQIIKTNIQELTSYSRTYWRILSDNSIIFPLIAPDELLFVKINSSGIITKYSVPVKINLSYYSSNQWFINIKEISPENIMFSISMPQAQIENDIKYKIGVVDFKNPSLSWNKEIGSGSSQDTDSNGSSFTLGENNTFFQVYTKPDDPSIKSFKIYDIKGILKWESLFVINNPPRTVQWRIIDNNLFTNVAGDKAGLVKVNCTDGKILWQKEGKFIKSFYSDIQKDNNGDDVIYYSYNKFDNKTNQEIIHEIAGLKSDGTEKWSYSLPKYISAEGNYFSVFFTPTNDRHLLIHTVEVNINIQNHILRKIKLCTALDPISLTGNTEACPTEKVKLSIQKQEGVTYQWQKDGNDIPNFKDAVYDIGESGIYTVNVKDEICQNQATSNALKISIRSLPNAEIKAVKTAFCEGDKTSINATTNGVFFQWQKDRKDLSNATSSTFEATQAGDYQVGVRDDKCPQVGYSNIVPITLKPSPEAIIITDIKTVIYEPFTVKMTANLGTNLSYQWLKDEVIIDNATTNIYEAKKSGKYKVSVTKDGCVKTSEALTISIQIPLATTGEIGEETVQIYPNPNQGKFKLILPKTLQNADIQLFDVLGRERKLIHTGEQAQADGLVQGTYFLRVNKGEKSVVNKIVIE